MESIRLKWLSWFWLGAAALLIAAVFVAVRPNPGSVPTSPPKQAQYAPAGSCRQCHAAIAASYRESGMARSFYKPAPENVPIEQPVQYYHAASGRHYEMFWRDGRLIQRRWQQGAEGRQANVFETEIHYVIGSGNHARTFLHRSANGEMTELPLTWYSDGKKWAMSPGFDGPKHPDFSRQIDHGCMFITAIRISKLEKIVLDASSRFPRNCRRELTASAVTVRAPSTFSELRAANPILEPFATRSSIRRG
jgi:hypothetical protein